MPAKEDLEIEHKEPSIAVNRRCPVENEIL